MATSKLTLKLLIDKKGKRVLFAEAGKDFVDFLFSLVTLPIGTVLSLVENKDMAGSFPTLYQSISDLNNEYIRSGQKKDTLLKPTTPSLPFGPPKIPILPIKEWSPSYKPSATPTNTATFYKCANSYCSPKLLFSSRYGSICSCGAQMTVATANPLATQTTGSASLYMCGSCRNSSTLSTTYDSRCTNKVGTSRTINCCGKMIIAVTDYVSKSQVDRQGGFVKESVTYMVADDLSVSPMSTTFNITLLNKFNIKDLSALEEKVVQICTDEALELLRHSFNSKTVLTNVFLREAEVEVKVKVKVKVKVEEHVDLESDSNCTTTRKRSCRGTPAGRR